MLPSTGALIRILHLDDNPLDARLVAMMLEIESERLPATIYHVQTKEEYLSALGRRDFDLILSDYCIAGYDGEQALEAAREICPEIPFIMVTGELSEGLASEVLRRGAADYVLKERIFRLIPAIERATAKSNRSGRAARNEQAAGVGRRRNTLKRIFHLHWKWNIRVRPHQSSKQQPSKHEG